MADGKVKHGHHKCPKSGNHYTVMPRFVKVDRKKQEAKHNAEGSK